MAVARGALLQALDEVGATTAAEAIDPATPVFGRNALLDSLGLVSMVVELEQRLDERCGLTIVLADERAMSRRSSPFRSLGALVDYIAEQAAVAVP